MLRSSGSRHVPLLALAVLLAASSSLYGVIWMAATDTGEQIPASSDLRRVKALWSIASEAGQRVATLVQKMVAAGQHTLSWDGLSDQGKPLASGVYLYRLQAGPQQVATRKLALVR